MSLCVKLLPGPRPRCLSSRLDSELPALSLQLLPVNPCCISLITAHTHPVILLLALKSYLVTRIALHSSEHVLQAGVKSGNARLPVMDGRAREAVCAQLSAPPRPAEQVVIEQGVLGGLRFGFSSGCVVWWPVSSSSCGHRRRAGPRTSGLNADSATTSGPWGARGGRYWVLGRRDCFKSETLEVTWSSIGTLANGQGWAW